MAIIVVLGTYYVKCITLLGMTWRKIGVPYIRAKAQDYYEELGGDESTGARQLRALTDPVGRYMLYA